jgi:hypothetical protein
VGCVPKIDSDFYSREDWGLGMCAGFGGNKYYLETLCHLLRPHTKEVKTAFYSREAWSLHTPGAAAERPHTRPGPRLDFFMLMRQFITVPQRTRSTPS